jgi:hypothetical protein
MTVEARLRDAVVGMLEERRVMLAVDGRMAEVVRVLDESAMGQARMPVVVVGRPEWSQEETRGRGDGLRVYTVLIGLVEAVRVSGSGVDEARERLGVLAEGVRGVLALPENQNLRMPDLEAFYSLCSWREVGEPEREGNNLMVAGLELVVPLTVGRS